MHAGRREQIWMFAGLGMEVFGGVWFILSVTNVLGGLAMMFGYFLGFGLALGGLIVAGVYFYRWQRIKSLLAGNDVLAKWGSGENQTIIMHSCAYVDGELALWGLPGTRLEDVQIERQASFGSEHVTLKITYGEAAGRARDPLTGLRLWRSRKLSIYVPPGQEVAAQSVLEQLRSRLTNS